MLVKDPDVRTVFIAHWRISLVLYRILLVVFCFASSTYLFGVAGLVVFGLFGS